jgi:hypothetical protein
MGQFDAIGTIVREERASGATLAALNFFTKGSTASGDLADDVSSDRPGGLGRS